MKKSRIKDILALFVVVALIGTASLFSVGCDVGAITTPTPESPTSPTPVPTATVTPSPTPSPAPTTSPTPEGLTFQGQVIGVDFVGLSGITIELRNQQGTLIDSTQTNESGAYVFEGLQTGTVYIIRFNGGGETRPSINYVVMLTSNKNVTGQLFPTYVQWQGILGGGRSISSGYGYIISNINDQSQNPLAGVSVSLAPSNYQELGYFQLASVTGPLFVDWNASSTSNLGSTIFYQVAIGSSYTATPTRSGYSFQPPLLPGVVPIDGEILVLPDFIGIQQ